MSAPHKNQNAAKEGKGVQVNFYISSGDTAAIKRHLTRLNGKEPTEQEIRHFARETSKNGIQQILAE